MSDYDFSEYIDASIDRYTASITNARLDKEGQPPKSTLTITGTNDVIFGSWTLGVKEFFTNDPDTNIITSGTWNVDKRCYTHEIWTGDYTPGTPLTEHTQREFRF